jgi:hypothetical protein
MDREVNSWTDGWTGRLVDEGGGRKETVINSVIGAAENCLRVTGSTHAPTRPCTDLGAEESGEAPGLLKDHTGGLRPAPAAEILRPFQPLQRLPLFLLNVPSSEHL